MSVHQQSTSFYGIHKLTNIHSRALPLVAVHLGGTPSRGPHTHEHANATSTAGRGPLWPSASTFSIHVTMSHTACNHMCISPGGVE